MKLSKGLIASIAAASLAVAATTAAAAPGHSATAAITTHRVKPTIVLVHGALEDGSAWAGVSARLQRAGYQVVVPALPLRGLASDTAYTASLLRTIKGPKVLVGHSYAGMVISAVAAQVPDITGLVYAAALIPEPGESLQGLVSKFTGSLFGPATYTVDYPGGTDVYVKPDQFRAVFAQDRPASEVAVGAASQRPIAASATTELATVSAPASIPKYALIATQDKAIPPAAERFMAARAKARTTEVRSSHDLPTSHPGQVTKVIEQAAGQR